MFHDGHKLYAVVAKVFNSWKDLFRKMLVGRDFTFARCNSNMSFINSQTTRLLWFLMLEYMSFFF